VMRSMGYNIW